MKEKDVNKPNKKIRVIGYLMSLAGVVMILLSIFVTKESLLGFYGFIILAFGAVATSVGKFGLEKTVEQHVETTTMVDKAKAKIIAKSVAEGIKEGLKEDKTTKKDKK